MIGIVYDMLPVIFITIRYDMDTKRTIFILQHHQIRIRVCGPFFARTLALTKWFPSFVLKDIRQNQCAYNKKKDSYLQGVLWTPCSDGFQLFFAWIIKL